MHLRPLVPGVVTPSPARARGAAWVLLLLGTLLMAAGVVLLIAVGAPDAFAELIGATWQHDPAKRVEPVSVGLWAAVGYLLIFGLVSMCQGVWGLRYGEANRLLVRVQMGLFVIFVVAGVIAAVMSGNRIGQLGS